MNSIFEGALGPAIEIARQYDELFIAMAKGPYMLLLKDENYDNFLNYAKEYPRHKVHISWSMQDDDGRTWTIRPAESDRINRYKISFKLPDILAKWIFSVPDNVRQRAIQTKEDYFSTISIYRYVEGKDYLFRLEYEPKNDFIGDGEF
jgi:hypothetical protein